MSDEVVWADMEFRMASPTQTIEELWDLFALARANDVPVCASVSLDEESDPMAVIFRWRRQVDRPTVLTAADI
jgi:hypothetical protein